MVPVQEITKASLIRCGLRSWRPAFSSPRTTFGGPMEETHVGDGTTDRWPSSLQAGSCRRSRTSSPPCPIQRRMSSGTLSTPGLEAPF
ncbi:unnamed protein product [Cyprideis torosa]|uniref:Uncharacterized protein n=1 Tax=Cyprideis torosa TaxID=163714 RepID=A0A7R8ZXR0_9CRUS|nr:unnamed protein product [Cyprideis torosa]CAG0907493.1 unnamed protein product [Cyprideis torosa]